MIRRVLRKLVRALGLDVVDDLPSDGFGPVAPETYPSPRSLFEEIIGSIDQGEWDAAIAYKASSPRVAHPGLAKALGSVEAPPPLDPSGEWQSSVLTIRPSFATGSVSPKVRLDAGEPFVDDAGNVARLIDPAVIMIGAGTHVRFDRPVGKTVVCQSFPFIRSGIGHLEAGIDEWIAIELATVPRAIVESLFSGPSNRRVEYVGLFVRIANQEPDRLRGD